MNNIIIPIGIDCFIADELRKNNKRFFSLPFDWTVTYNGITDIIKNNFIDYLPKIENNSLVNLLSNTYFIHNKFPNDYDKMNRRIHRFRNLLNEEINQLIFIRKSHCLYHHDESILYNCKLKNDITDCEELYDYLKINYPKLNFKIMIILMCNNCFSNNYSEKIKIIDINELNNLFNTI